MRGWMQSDGWQLQAFEDFLVECQQVLWDECVGCDAMEGESGLPAFIPWGYPWGVEGLKATWGDSTPDVDKR